MAYWTTPSARASLAALQRCKCPMFNTTGPKPARASHLLFTASKAAVVRLFPGRSSQSQFQPTFSEAPLPQTSRSQSDIAVPHCKCCSLPSARHRTSRSQLDDAPLRSALPVQSRRYLSSRSQLDIVASLPDGSAPVAFRCSSRSQVTVCIRCSPHMPPSHSTPA